MHLHNVLPGVTFKVLSPLDLLVCPKAYLLPAACVTVLFAHRLRG